MHAMRNNTWKGGLCQPLATHIACCTVLPSATSAWRSASQEANLPLPSLPPAMNMLKLPAPPVEM